MVPLAQWTLCLTRSACGQRLWHVSNGVKEFREKSSKARTLEIARSFLRSLVKSVTDHQLLWPIQRFHQSAVTDPPIGFARSLGDS